MTALEWDKLGERNFDAGIQQGVLYLSSGRGVPWNGLVSLDENASEETLSFFLDGLKYLDVPSIEDYEAKLSAFMYPDEFLEYDGVISLENGALVGNQPAQQFGLSYKTLVGNDLKGVEFGYKIHLVYNLTAQIDLRTYSSNGQNVAPLVFAWTVTGVPEHIPGYRPTAHVIFDTTKLNPFFVKDLEDILYGSDTEDARLPSLLELQELAIEWKLFTVTDNGDGTWTIEGPEELITLFDGSLFQIDQLDVTYLDEHTYTIPTTDP